MCGDVQRPLVRIQTGDDTETGFVDRTLGFLGIFEGNTDLITDLRALVVCQLGKGLGEIILEEVEKCCVIVFGHATVLQKQRAIGDQGLGSLSDHRDNQY